ncbi:class I SAM-dependent methyltransferase [Candidatus Gracilibacteria bacterium]|nr:class I SAM-dependent methyltransferase [Candidatus Gracilibacteria bacterium]
MKLLDITCFSFKIIDFEKFIKDNLEGSFISFYNKNKELIAHISIASYAYYYCKPEQTFSFSLGTFGRWQLNKLIFEFSDTINFEILDKTCFSINNNKIISHYFIREMLDGGFVVIGKRDESLMGFDDSISIDFTELECSKKELLYKEYSFDYGYLLGVGDLIWGLCNKKNNDFISSFNKTKKGERFIKLFYSENYYLDEGYVEDNYYKLEKEYYDEFGYRRYYSRGSDFLNYNSLVENKISINFCGQNARLEIGIPFTKKEVDEIKKNLFSSTELSKENVLDFNGFESNVFGSFLKLLLPYEKNTIFAGIGINEDSLKDYYSYKNPIETSYQLINKSKYVAGEACGFHIYAGFKNKNGYGVLPSFFGGLSWSLTDLEMIESGKMKIESINCDGVRLFNYYKWIERLIRDNFDRWYSSYNDHGNVTCPVCFCKQNQVNELEYECSYCETFVTKSKERFVYTKEYIDIYKNYPHDKMNKIRERFIDDSKTVLDYGCGGRYFVDFLLGKGYDAYGYDIIPNNNNLEWKDLFNRIYDCVTFFDSFEHIENPHKELSVLLGLAKKVVITIPFVNNYSDINDIKKYKHYRPGEHLFHYKEQSLEKFMLQHGFSLYEKSFSENKIRGCSIMGPSVVTYIFKDQKIIPYFSRLNLIKDYFKYEDHYK